MPGSRQLASGIGHLRFHDLRGTAATNFARAGLRIEDIALVMGWERRRVEQIVFRYVTGDAIAQGWVEQLRKNASST